MDTIFPFHNSYKHSLLLLTVLMLIVDVVILITLVVKSDGFSSLTKGDVIVISVVGVFTLCILVADVIYFVTTNRSGRRLGPFYKKTEANSDFVCSICLDESKDDTVKLKCGHDFHEKCISKYINQSMEDCTCPLCRKSLEQFKELWVAKFTTKTMLILNWPQLLKTDKNEKGPVSIV